jgi:hypothetical protein
MGKKENPIDLNNSKNIHQALADQLSEDIRKTLTTKVRAATDLEYVLAYF